MLVGRHAELELLAASFAANRPVALLGEPGVGKTTLLRAAAEASGRRVFEGGALGTLARVDYLALRRALGRPIPLGDAEFVAAEVEREVGDGVLLLDDLHWADPSTRAVLPLVAGRIAVATAIRRGAPETQAAVDAARDAGCELLELEPLGDEEAAAVARAVRTDLSAAALRRLVRQAGGNPLLLGELAATGKPSESLRLALAARLRGLSPEGRESMGLLALLGRPAERDALGAAAAELVEAGLAAAQNGRIALRHALLGEALIEELGEADRSRLHSRLAGSLDDPGEAAYHHAAAGELDDAFRKASSAAAATQRLGDRARLLGLAASCVTGAASTALRVDAARALTDAGEYDQALDVLERVNPDDPPARGWLPLLRSRARWYRGEPEAARAELDDGLAAASGDAEVRLRIDDARLTLLYEADAEAGHEKAQHALELARSRGVEEHRALYVLGTAQYYVQDERWSSTLESALERAREQEDHEVECTAANNLISGHESSGDPQRGRELARLMVDRSQELRLLRWQRQFRALLGNLDLHAGAYAEVIESAEQLLAEAIDERTREQVELAYAVALIDVGKHRAAQERVDRLLQEAAPDSFGRGNALWVRAEAAFWGGRVRAALAAADECLAYPQSSGSIRPFAQTTRAWAALELGRDPGQPAEDPGFPLLAAVPTETEAVGLLAREDAAAAAARFDEAASLWARYHRRGELRCAWGAGEALRRAGKVPAARARLETVEARALEHGMLPLAARVRRSLRLAGVRRSAPRTPSAGALTAREREVLELVGEGLSNAEIARRLGVSRSTVVRLIELGSTKLGATSRAQAAALASRR